MYVGRCGMKQLLLPSPQQVLHQIPHAHTAMDIGLMARDESYVAVRYSVQWTWHLA